MAATTRRSPIRRRSSCCAEHREPVMTTAKRLPRFTHTAIALAILSACGPVGAQEIDALMAPGNSLSVGIGFVSGDEKDRARFGLYNGLRTEDYRGLLGFSIVDRNPDTGRWFSVEGRNL